MYVVDLSDSEFIRISGEDAVSFLQGQVSCDMNQLGPDNSLRGALCNLKGRVIADFRIARSGDAYLLQTQAGVGDTVLQTLAKYAVFSKVTIEADMEFNCAFGVFGDDIAERLKNHLPEPPQTPNGVTRVGNALVICLAGPTLRFEIWGRSPEELNWLLQNSAGEQAGLADWRQQEFMAGEIHVNSEMSGNYTPQLLNYDLSGVINFKKGCYTGQEVVARMYFRSRAKKRLYLLSSNHPVDDPSELTLRWDGKSEPGEVLARADGGVSHPERHLILALLATEGVSEHGSLQLTAGSQPLEIVKLPYMDPA